ncbi:MAG: extracellular solute-binding protein [Desulfobacterales bacterium]|nr:extracellular solute-binding protein [Desulfobacterales bacterium]
MYRRIKLWFFIIVCGPLLSFQPFAAHADPLDPYIQAAEKEGQVRIGVTLRNKVSGKPAGELYFAAFQKRYPFIKVNFKRIGGSRERERVITEMTAGIYNYDVATIAETQIDTLTSLKLARVLDWQKLGVPKFLAHPENIAVSLRTPVFGIAYNRDLVPDEVARTFTWETCTDPKWRGKSAIKTRPRHLEMFYQKDVWGREKTLDYARRWMAVKPSVESSRSTGATKLMAGAYHFMCGTERSQVKDLQVYSEAKNIGIVFPEPVPVGVGDLIFVADKAKHSNAAVLFLVWTATKEAQNLLDDINFSGHPAYEGIEINQVLKGKKLAEASWEDTARADEVLKEILLTMGMPVVQTATKKKKK